jgi:hypothetical protein
MTDTIKTSVYFPPEMYEKLLKESADEMRSFTKHVVYLVQLGLNVTNNNSGSPNNDDK